MLLIFSQAIGFALTLLLAWQSFAEAARAPLFRHGAHRGYTKSGTKQEIPTAKEKRQVPSYTSGNCSNGAQIATTAPKKNVFMGLTGTEAADVTAFLHRQEDLNLTAAENATSWDNKLLLVEMLQPNKSDALLYLDSNGAPPTRYARVAIRHGSTPEPYVQEYQVGPLPVSSRTNVAPLEYIYNKGRGYQRIYDLDKDSLEEFMYGVGTAVADITRTLLGGVAVGAENDTLIIAVNAPLLHEDDKIFQWSNFYSKHTGPFWDETLLPTSMQFKTDITGRDPSQWAVVGWNYNGIFYNSIADFKLAMNSTEFDRPGPVVDGDWAGTDYSGDPFPNDEKDPPVAIQPAGSRFALDEKERYVEWMDFSFYMSFNRDLGLQLHEIHYKGERVIYELGLQEALAHYASASDPFQAANAYLDSEYGFGDCTFQLVSGFDCPAYATFLETSYYELEKTHTHPSSICLFEHDTGYPIQRHTGVDYVSVTKNIAFIVRSIATVGNYDYMFDYEFYLDGSIHVTVRASGYIQSSFWTTKGTTGADGFHIYENLGGSIHDHVLNYKLDLDVGGTANSLAKSAFVPTSAVYPWSNGRKINAMKTERSFVSSEDDAKLNWGDDNAVTYTVVNKDSPNKYGEYRGWKILPATNQKNHLTVQNSTLLGNSVNWATHHLYAVRRKDTEPRSGYSFNGWDPNDPVVDFDKFFDGESLEQEDLVIYFNLGMHHMPDTSDIPNTVFSSAQSSMIIAPQNYLPRDPSRGTIHQARLNLADGAVASALTFGVRQSTCAVDLSIAAPDLQNFVGDSYVPKYPYLPNAQTVANPGDPGNGLDV